MLWYFARLFDTVAWHVVCAPMRGIGTKTDASCTSRIIVTQARRKLAALRNWQRAADIERRKVDAWATAAAHHRRQALHALVTAWREQATRLARKRCNIQLADAYCRKLCLLSGLHQLRAYARQQRAEAMAHAWHLGQLQQCALTAWWRHAAYKQHIERLRRRAVRFRCVDCSAPQLPHPPVPRSTVFLHGTLHLIV